MVSVSVRLGEEESFVEVPEGTTVEILLGNLEPRWRGNALVAINGKVACSMDSIRASDRVSILPLLAGG